MSSTGVQTSNEMTRRHLSPRQIQTVDALVEAAVDELTVVGYGGLSVRGVSKRAGVAPATAYTYFASRDHLIAEVFWRRLSSQPDTLESDDLVERVAQVLQTFGLVVAEESELAAACTVAVLAQDPNVSDLRMRIGAELNRRLKIAIGAHVDPAVLRTLQFATSGALLQVGTGHLGYADLPRLLNEAARTILGPGITEPGVTEPGLARPGVTEQRTPDPGAAPIPSSGNGTKVGGTQR